MSAYRDRREYSKKFNNLLPSAFVQEASQVFEIKGIPSIVLVNKQGRIIFKKYIDMDKEKGFDLEKIWTMIKAE